jgi:hypothetical protein
MVYNTQNYRGFRLCPSSGTLNILGKRTFWKVDLFPSSYEGEDTLFSSLVFQNTGRWAKSITAVILTFLLCPEPFVLSSVV